MVCLSDIDWAKTGFERCYLRRMRKGKAEARYERGLLRLFGISRPPRSKSAPTAVPGRPPGRAARRHKTAPQASRTPADV